MGAVAQTRAALGRLREFFLLEQAEARATKLTGEAADRVRALALAAEGRLRAEAELGTSAHAAALVLQRDALVLLARARMLETDPSLLDDEAGALEGIGLALDALADPERTERRAAFESLRDPEALAFDRLSREDAQALRARGSELLSWLAGTIEARTPGKLRAMRWVRMSALAFALAALAYRQASHRWGSHDVALHATVKASSRYPFTPDAKGLTDGDTHALGVHTWLESNPEITIELSHKYAIRTVRVHSRTDCCADESLPLVVEVGDEGDHDPPFTATRAEHFDAWDVDVGGRKAETVKIKLPKHGYIALAEVEVFADE